MARSLPIVALKTAGSLGFAAAIGAAGCLSRPIETLEPKTTSTVFEHLNQGSINAIDILLAIDNSRSMADKQEILALAVPDLVKGLVNPRCLDKNGEPSASQPAGPLDPCPVDGAVREFEPITDIHIGIISSSLGGHGADSCPQVETQSCRDGSPNQSNNDKGHLLSRRDPCADGGVPTYQEKGFLAWDPKQKLKPAGEHDIEVDTDGDGRALAPDLKDLVKGVGQAGCGFESQLESWYRFLVDPEPYATISIVDTRATPEGRDDELLAERRDFLRPDSLVAIVLLSDENDCSIKEYGQYYYAGQLENQKGGPFHLPRPRAECAVNPDDPCCKPCNPDPGECPVDPTCFDGNGKLLYLTNEEDPSGLRCFDQKRRFGVDFLYPIDRYSKALKSPTVPNRAGELVPNPLFSDLDPTDTRVDVRGPDRVFFAGIVGVPWQDIARDKDDLSKGLKTNEELSAPLASGQTTWDIILGNPATRTPPEDPHMIESTDPRTGESPITGTPMVAPGNPLSDPINGSERPIKAHNDLEYACTFQLPTPRDCTDEANHPCDCNDTTNSEVLCADTPGNPGDRMLQVKAKAYPGIRELSLLREIGPQGIVASVCPSQLDTPEKADFGYRPAIGSIVEQLKEKLRGQCLPRKLALTDDGSAPCHILEARKVDEGNVASCNQCAEGGRSPATAFPTMVSAAKDDINYEAAGWNCFCMIDQLKGDEKAACQNDTALSPLNASTGEPVNGWCYVDATTEPPTGNPDLVQRCADTEKHLVRFVGDAGKQSGSTLFIYCDTSAAE